MLTRRDARLVAAISSALATSVALAGPARAQEFDSIGFLPGGTFSFATGISANSMVIVGFGDSTNYPFEEAFRWTEGTGMVGLGAMTGGSYSQAFAVNADGSVVVGSGDSTFYSSEAFRWTQGTGMVGLGVLSGGTLSTATGVSADGSVVVGTGDSMAYGSEAFRWTQGTGMVGLGVMTGGSYSEASGVSADGSVVAGTGDSASYLDEAFRWTLATGMVGLGVLPGGTSSFASAISADGTVIVGNGDSSSHAQEIFRWTQTTGMVGLGVLPGGNISIANAVNADGSVIVGYGDDGVSFNPVALRWTPGDGMQSIRALLVSAGVDMTGWELVMATGVSANGNTIVGWGYVGCGCGEEAWVARFGPDGAGITTPGAQQKSVNDLAEDRFGLLAQQHGFAVPLLGGDKPMASSNEAGIFASAGSAAAGGFVRYSTGMGLSVLAGLSYGQEDYPDAELKHSGMGALALQYIDPGKGWWRSFAELGGWGTPDASMSFDRTYGNGAGTATATGNTHGDLGYIYARAGLLLVNNAADQVALSGEIGREWLQVDGYSEAASPGNLFPAIVGGGTDRADLLKARLQWSHQFSHAFDATLWVAGVHAFNRASGLEATVPGVGVFGASDLDAASWVEYGARVGYKLTETLTLDVFGNGVSGSDEIETRVHGGLGLRFQY